VGCLVAVLLRYFLGRPVAGTTVALACGCLLLITALTMRERGSRVVLAVSAVLVILVFSGTLIQLVRS